MVDDNEKKYWVAFSKIENIGPVKFKQLISYFSDLQKAWQAESNDLIKSGLYPKDVEKIIHRRLTINPDQEWEYLIKNNIKVITIKDSGYPDLLKEIHSPPAILYYRGNLIINSEFSLAVVGTRRTSLYGRQITPDIVSSLSRTGLTIISGLALGIDTIAHQTALRHGGQTVAVLGNGLDIVYPISNKNLAHEIIAKSGSIISEYPPGTRPLKQHFPARNRIISGLARGVLVIEGGSDSGSLITARFAVEQNREVFGIPGNIINNNAKGPNSLIKLGAHVVTSAQDIIDVLNIKNTKQIIKNKKLLPTTKTEKDIFELLSPEPVHIDEIIKKSTLDTSIINATLTIMEMKGMITDLGANNYIRT